MLYAFGFERYGVVVSDLYHVDPNPGRGQEGAERGVRLEVRLLERGELRGSIYSAQPIGVEQPIWRVDLLETVTGPYGSFDRTHHHPAFRGWEPGKRMFVKELSADPIGWLRGRLSDLEGVLKDAGADADPADAGDAADAAAMRERVPEILDAVNRLLDGIRAGKLAVSPPGDTPACARDGWL